MTEFKKYKASLTMPNIKENELDKIFTRFSFNRKIPFQNIETYKYEDQGMLVTLRITTLSDLTLKDNADASMVMNCLKRTFLKDDLTLKDMIKDSYYDIKSITYEYSRGDRKFVPTTTIYNEKTVANWDGSDNGLLGTTESGKEITVNDIYRYKEFLDESATPLNYNNSKEFKYVDDKMLHETFYVTLCKRSLKEPTAFCTLIIGIPEEDTDKKLEVSKRCLSDFLRTFGFIIGDDDLENESILLEEESAANLFEYLNTYNNYQPFGITSVFSKEMIQTVDKNNPTKDSAITSESLLGFLANTTKPTTSNNVEINTARLDIQAAGNATLKRFMEGYIDEIPKFFIEHYKENWEKVEKGLSEPGVCKYIAKVDDIKKIHKDIISNLFPDYLKYYLDNEIPVLRDLTITSSMLNLDSLFIGWKEELEGLIKDVNFWDYKTWAKELAIRLTQYAFIPSHNWKRWEEEKNAKGNGSKAESTTKSITEAMNEHNEKIKKEMVYIDSLYRDYWQKVADSLNAKNYYTITVDDLIEGNLRYYKSIGAVSDEIRKSTEELFRNLGFKNRTLTKTDWDVWGDIGEREIASNGFKPIVGGPVITMDLIRSYQFVPPKNISDYIDYDTESA